MEKIRNILAETFHICESDITLDIKIKDIDSLDSLTHMEMIANLESELNIEFSANDIMQMTDVTNIEKIVEDKLNGN